MLSKLKLNRKLETGTTKNINKKGYYGNLNRKVKATGGLTFILIATIGSLCINFISSLSSMDMAKSMANQAAYFSTYRSAILLYNSNSPSGSYNYITDESSGISFDPLQEYNNVLQSAFDSKVGTCNGFTIHWNKSTKTATAYVREVSTILTNKTVTPDTQKVIME